MVFVVTGNRGKFLQIKSLLAERDIDAVQFAMDLKEHGDTIEEIVREKARQAFEKLQEPLIVDDTGIFFEAYENFPGVFSKRIFNAIGYDGIFRLLDGKTRDACFRTILCFTDGSRYELFEGLMYGRITNMVYEGGRDDLPFERIFVPDGNGQVMTFMTEEEKLSLSHRGKATKKFAEWYVRTVRES